MTKALFAALALVTLLASPTFAQTANSPTVAATAGDQAPPAMVRIHNAGGARLGFAQHTRFRRNRAHEVAGRGFSCLAAGSYSFASMCSSIHIGALRAVRIAASCSPAARAPRSPVHNDPIPARDVKSAARMSA
jgi:hypothetical protein